MTRRWTRRPLFDTVTGERNYVTLKDMQDALQYLKNLSIEPKKELYWVVSPQMAEDFKKWGWFD